MAAKLDKNRIFKIISYNVMSNGNCSGLLTLLDIEKPDVVLLQEILLNTEHLSTFIGSRGGYKAESNVHALEPTKPGTALVWREDANTGR